MYESFSREMLASFANGGQLCRIDSVRLRQNGQAVPYTQQVTNREMLPGLRLHALLSRNHQENEINTTRTRQHVADKRAMAGNVDKTQQDRGAVSCLHFTRGEAKIYGDAATLLGRQMSRVNTGEGFD